MIKVLVISLLLPLCLGHNDKLLRAELYKIQKTINSNRKDIIRPQGDQMHPASAIFLTEHWRNYTGDKPIMVRRVI